MRAAVVTSFNAAPQCQELPTPVAGEGEMVVTVLASAIHPRVRSQADGSHYTSTDELPLVPGIDGVGRTAEGEVRYFILPDTALGAMAEQTLIDPRRSVVLPGDIDPVLIAAAMNPAMSSWIALRRRIDFTPGSRVLIMGATGNAGRMAVQVARRSGAGHIAVAGRNPHQLAQLASLGADAVIDLGCSETVAHELAAVGRDVDVVLDYLWGEWASKALYAIVPARDDDAQQLTWIQIGSITGPESPIPSAALRACNLRLIGSGQGSVSPHDIVTELPALATEVTSGEYDLPVRAVPLDDVTAAWEEAATTDTRLVLTP
ncbi:zinc-binding alcohol dehydrogenase family protein [Cellulomonas iranensis]|uniref:quinone oxidoreductase family protein n=1 Tax=Cellulomonas iranensis TaxID=76862 RepID=UPI001CF200EB|nr:zinc-binding alcohol dehydrogenase family protein [Cellulomonas iranensis]UCN14395.1 zinc-binding alcohol dehydrogenase family protein [Cellulomonas iranensis]